jgi:hypothetical protein
MLLWILTRCTFALTVKNSFITSGGTLVDGLANVRVIRIGLLGVLASPGFTDFNPGDLTEILDETGDSLSLPDAMEASLSLSLDDTGDFCLKLLFL